MTTQKAGTNSNLKVTNTLGVLFTTPFMKKMSADYNDLQVKYGKMQSNVVKEIIGITASYFSVLEQASDLIAVLDVIQRYGPIIRYFP